MTEGASPVSRAGAKLEFALTTFGLQVTDKICADLGCSTGGFTEVLLTHGAQKVYSVDTGFGVLDWHLRQNPKVICMERTNALFVDFPEKIDFISVDVGWTPQHLILPHAADLLSASGNIVSLFKPHYESHQAHLTAEKSRQVLDKILADLIIPQLTLRQVAVSPITGKKGGNTEYLLWFSHQAV